MWQIRKVYAAGAIVVDRRGLVQCSKVDDNDRPPGDPFVTTNNDWAALGASGAMPTKAIHAWNPGDMQYPCGTEGEMSELAVVCKDCIKDADFRNAFDAKNHLYIIREIGPPLD
jgi:hypothetical protein